MRISCGTIWDTFHDGIWVPLDDKDSGHLWVLGPEACGVIKERCKGWDIDVLKAQTVAIRILPVNACGIVKRGL